jgi:hypothetical protein
MSQQEAREFSWPTLFIVTSSSFFAFAAFTKLINGTAWHSALFFRIGFVSFVFFAITYAKTANKPGAAKKKIKRYRRNRVINY